MDLCRIYLTQSSIDQFDAVLSATEDLKEQFSEMQLRDKKPKDFGLMIKESSVLGHLVVVKVEMVSPEYEGNSVSLLSTIKDILALISNEITENCFTDKVEALGIDVFGKEIGDKYDVKSVISYSVGDGFPRITDREIPYPEIVGINYNLFS